MASLRQHGALDDLPDFNRIEVRRPGTGYAATIFLKGTNDWNRFTLLDAVYGKYGPTDMPAGPGIPGAATPSYSARLAAIQARGMELEMPFPDLHRIVVVRASAKAGQPARRITVDLLLPTGVVDCTKDVPLEFGDVVEIPEREHTLQESPQGSTDEELQQIVKCREGKVGLLVRGKRTELQVLPSKGSAIIWSVLTRQEVRSALFSSSDLSRLKVTRRDPASGKQHEWIVDCSGGKYPDLWLRDGDVIEVPDKP